MSELTFSPAVYGIETEYSCMITLPGNVVHEIVGGCHSVDKSIGLYVEPRERGSSGIPYETLVDSIEAQGLLITPTGMLSNGGRFYLDPSGPEYDTPETATAEEAVHRTFDGDEIMLKAFNYLLEEDAIKDFQLNRRIVDHNRTSRGIHLNTLTKIKNHGPSVSVGQRLAALNVVKGAVFGSGGLLVGKDGRTDFHHSPRLSLTNQFSSHYANYSQRPLVRTPFKEDGQSLARIETVTSDALNFAWPLRASLVATNALVAVIELGYGNKLPRLTNPVESAQIVGKFGNKHPIREITTKDELRMAKPVDILRRICDTIREVNAREGFLDKESYQVIDQIDDVGSRMTVDPRSVVKQVESIAREAAIKKRMRDKKVQINSETICRFDYVWDKIGGGVAEALRKDKKIGWDGFTKGYSVLDSNKRQTTPPNDTRAKVRGNLIAADFGDNMSDWHQIQYDDRPYYVHPLDPNGPKAPKKPTEVANK